MSRQTKLKFAAVVTTLVAALGTVGVGATTASIDAGKSDKMTGGGWCC